MTDIFQKCNLFDKNFRISDLDLHIKAANFSMQSSQLNPTFGTIRHEFMEILLRAAMDKYNRSGVCSDEHASFSRFADEIRPYFSNFDHNK